MYGSVIGTCEYFIIEILTFKIRNFEIIKVIKDYSVVLPVLYLLIGFNYENKQAPYTYTTFTGINYKNFLTVIFYQCKYDSF